MGATTFGFFLSFLAILSIATLTFTTACIGLRLLLDSYPLSLWNIFLFSSFIYISSFCLRESSHLHSGRLTVGATRSQFRAPVQRLQWWLPLLASQLLLLPWILVRGEGCITVMGDAGAVPSTNYFGSTAKLHDEELQYALGQTTSKHTST